MNRSHRPRRSRPDPRIVIPSVTAAAHCAQSCLRFWNLLLQDSVSVNPFCISPDGYDRAEEEDEDAEQPFEHDEDKEDSPVEAEEKLQIVAVAGDEDGNEEEDDEKWELRGHGFPIPRPESYMKPRTVHWWNLHVGFAREDDPSYADVFQLPVGFLTTVCRLCREDMQQGDIPMSLRLEGRVMSVERQVAIAVMRLTTGNTLKTVSELLGCGRSTVVKIVNKFVAAVRCKAGFYLQWPTSPEQLGRVKEGFLNKHGLLNCCGALDSLHILMELPSGEPADIWVDKNHNFSMVLQAVVDTELRFLDVCVGHPGSMNDTRCLKESVFYKKCMAAQRLNGEHMRAADTDISIGEYVVADAEYPLFPWLMRPYRENETTPQRAFYNDKLYSSRIAIARAFGRLKGTWKMFHGLVKQPNIERMPKMIHACCIMHNMCIEFGGVEGVHFPEPEAIVQAETENLGDAEETEEGKQVRNNLCTYLNTLPHL